MKKWLRSCVIAVVALVSASSALVGIATADQTSPGQGLEISPPVIELQANPGQTLTTQIRVRNIANGTLNVKGKADDFGAGKSEDGKPQLLLDETGATRYSLKYWIQPITSLTLAPKELKTVTVTIAVPNNAEPGGHFGVVRFTGTPPSLEGTGVALSASVGTLILLRVAGAVTDQVSLESFNTVKTIHTKGQPDTTVPSKFFEYGPVTFEVRVKNSGSVHEKVSGTIDITDAFGNKIGQVLVNETGGNVLPDSIRRFEETFGKKNLMGFFKAKLSLTYLDGTKTLSGSTSFWVIPWKAILLVFAVLVFLFFLLRWGFKKYNAYIIAQARKR